jgi:alpha-ribazole phosphatase
MTKLILVRHGQTDWNREGRYQGQSDPPLNLTGRQQAQLLADKLADRPLDAIYSSDLRRATETAQIIAQRHGLPVRQDQRLREINQGEWEGLRVSEIITRYPQIWAVGQHDPLQMRAPGGEAPAEVAERVWAAISDIARVHPAGAVLIVSHGFALATLLIRIHGAPFSQIYDYIPDNADIKEIEWC